MSDDSLETLRKADYLSAADKKCVGCLCTWEFGDSACPVHPTCPECGARAPYTESARAILALTAERDRLNLEILRLQSDLAYERGRVQGMTETVAFLRSTKEGLF